MILVEGNHICRMRVREDKEEPRWLKPNTRIETDTLSCAETFGYAEDYEHDQGMQGQRNKRYSGESECF